MFSGFLFLIAGLFMFFDGLAARRDAKVIREFSGSKKGFHTRVRQISSGVMGLSFLAIGLYFIINSYRF